MIEPPSIEDTLSSFGAIQAAADAVREILEGAARARPMALDEFRAAMSTGTVVCTLSPSDGGARCPHCGRPTGDGHGKQR